MVAAAASKASAASAALRLSGSNAGVFSLSGGIGRLTTVLSGVVMSASGNRQPGACLERLVDGHRRLGSLSRGHDHELDVAGSVAGNIQPGDACLSEAIGFYEPLPGDCAPQLFRQVALWPLAGAHEDGLAC